MFGIGFVCYFWELCLALGLSVCWLGDLCFYWVCLFVCWVTYVWHWVFLFVGWVTYVWHWVILFVGWVTYFGKWLCYLEQAQLINCFWNIL